jgi:hypothetical protein
MKFDTDKFTTEAVLQAYRYVSANVDELKLELVSKNFVVDENAADLRAMPITIDLNISKPLAAPEDKATVEQALIKFKVKIQGA